MTVVIFILVLAVLILVHEFGHFIVAKKNGIRVDEFGLGFPPKLWGKKYGETEYTVNAFPVGGFVRIFGENPQDAERDEKDAPRSFAAKPAHVRAAVIGAGIAFNLAFAWTLISVGFLVGLPSSADGAPAGASLRDISAVVTEVVPGSPADVAGLREGDRIASLEAPGEVLRNPSADEVVAFVAEHTRAPIVVSYKRRGGEAASVPVTARDGIVAVRPAVGIAISDIGIATLPIHRAMWEGGKLTIDMTILTAAGLYEFFSGLVAGDASFSEVAGPVGIVGIVGDAASFGFAYLLSLTALISINLALINLIPFPALDGGRLLFLAIETVKGSPLNPKIAAGVNAAGFAALIMLMIAVTYNDILRLLAG